MLPEILRCAAPSPEMIDRFLHRSGVWRNPRMALLKWWRPRGDGARASLGGGPAFSGFSSATSPATCSAGDVRGQRFSLRHAKPFLQP